MNNRITRGRKFDQVLAAAREVFMKHGYERANVDEIARVAGVSKATLYNYFPDKRILFAEAAREEAERQAKLTFSDIDPTAPPEVTLTVAGQNFHGFITSELGIAQTLMCASESRKFPELGQMFYETGPQFARTVLGDYLKFGVAQGHFLIDDIELAADQFIELCKARIMPRILCGVNTEFSPEELDLIVTGAVEMFMAHYGVRRDQ